MVISCPPYWRIGANCAPFTAGLFAGGNTIFCAASWVCTSLVTKLWPQVSKPPATSSSPAISTPAVTASASNVLLRI